MCGRYTLTVEKDVLSERFGLLNVIPDYRPRYNAAPGQYLPVLLTEGSDWRMEMMKWGLVPFWAKDAAIGNRMINARLESLAEKPAFRRSLHQRRCLVPADGYYEWQKEGRTKQALRIVTPGRELFVFAGLWDEWLDSEGQVLHSFTIITTNPVPSIASIHDRMPLILKPEQESTWLEYREEPGKMDAASFLNQFAPLEELEGYRVSSLVNSPRNDSEELILDIDGENRLFD